jgi:transposase
MLKRKSLIPDELWARIDAMLPRHEPSPHGGRSRLDDRWCLEGIVWMLHSGARWQDLPDCFPSPSTCWRRLKEWEETGVWEKVWQSMLGELDSQGRLDLEETFGDGTFIPAKKGDLWSARRSAARGLN